MKMADFGYLETKLGVCHFAIRPWERLIGLLGCRGLVEGECLLLKPCGAIHTLGMRFTLDVIFLNRTGHVVRMVRNLRPGCWGCWGGSDAWMVLEAQAGWLPPLAIGTPIWIREKP